MYDFATASTVMFARMTRQNCREETTERERTDRTKRHFLWNPIEVFSTNGTLLRTFRNATKTSKMCNPTCNEETPEIRPFQTPKLRPFHHFWMIFSIFWIFF